MSRCTAPVRGHYSPEAEANCPACGGRSSFYPSYAPPYVPPARPAAPPSGTSESGGAADSTSNGGKTARPRWSPSSSPVAYSATEVRALTPLRERIEARGAAPDRRDVFLCHAWDDRRGPAKDLHDGLEAAGVSVWFSEKDVLLGTPLMREIDRGLANSRAGLVLVTPSFLKRLQAAGVADKELSVLLAREVLLPVVHDTTFEELVEVSPLLASRSGLNTAEDSMEDIILKIKELVSIEELVSSEDESSD